MPTLQMKCSKAIGFAAAALFSALWAVPLARAVSFVRWAQEYFRQDGTVNASNDLHYSVWLLTCYAVSLLAAFVFAWILTRRPRFLLVLPGVLLMFAGVEVLWLHPEEPIHLFPTMTPWRPAVISVVAVAVAALLRFVPHRSRNERNA